jgi:DNA helicase-2/ATP-dependent DNA helicase PcrA
VIIGPPGTGKTSEGLRIVGEALRAGVPPHRIAIVTFTKAATREVRRRLCREFGLDADQLPHVRTIHSTAFGLLGWQAVRLMDDAAWQRFGARHGYRFSRVVDTVAADEPFCPPIETPADRYRALLSWGRNRRLSLEEMIARRPFADLDPDGIRLFASRLAAFKNESDLHDFEDMLACALSSERTPAVDLAIVDEAQDLSPLQLALAEKWFAATPRFVVVGDDDQAIYGFNGARPEWLVELAQRTTPTILTQSRRVPRAAHSLATTLIAMNRNRVAKEYLPRPEQGEVLVLELDAALARIDGREPTFVLVRNRKFLPRCARALRDARIPYVVEGGGAPSVLSDPRVRPALAVAVRLAREGADAFFDAEELRTLLQFVRADVLPRGAKAAVERARGRVRPADFGLGPFVLAAAEGGPAELLPKIPAADRAYLRALIAGGRALAEPQVILTTIHGAKGREADLVVVLPDMARKTWDAYEQGGERGREAERRVFYVGLTRTKRTLILVRPTTKRAFRYPSVRREEGVL